MERSVLGDLDLNKMNTARDIWQIKYLSDVSIYITVRASFTDLNDKYSDFRVFRSSFVRNTHMRSFIEIKILFQELKDKVFVS